MMELTIEESNYSPGASLGGQASWQLAKPPQSLNVYLLWHTEGIGDKDSEAVDTYNIPSPGASGSASFSFTLPSKPLSFRGKCISLLWSVELLAEGFDEIAQASFTLTKEGKVIELGTVEDVGARKSISQFQNR